MRARQDPRRTVLTRSLIPQGEVPGGGDHAQVSLQGPHPRPQVPTAQMGPAAGLGVAPFGLRSHRTLMNHVPRGVQSDKGVHPGAALRTLTWGGSDKGVHPGAALRILAWRG